MRQIGTLPTESEAKRFTAYMITEAISVHAEQEGAEWAIWIRDENHLEKAREKFSHFREHPNDVRYEGVEQQADAMLREEVKRHDQARKHVVQMGDKWGQPGAGRKKPVTVVVIIACVAIAMMSNFGKDPKSKVTRALLFCDTYQPETWDKNSVEDRLVNIKQGQVWRVITPNLFHYGTMHLIFNMLMFFQLGGRVENSRGSLRFAIMIFAFGFVAVAAQSLVPSAWGGSPFGAGLSGVVYGLFGYMWMKTVFDPSPELFLGQGTVIILMVWFFLGVFGVLGTFGMHIANWAHGGGLLLGIAIGYAPEMIKVLKKR